jgi:DNA repair protein RadC
MARRRAGRGAEQPAAATLFRLATAAPEPPEEDQLTPLQELLLPYVDLVTLRRLAANGDDLRAALRSQVELPEELAHLFEIIKALLRPAPGERIKNPTIMAGILMAEMSHLDQEQLRVACLDTKNKLQKVHLVYQGSLNTSLIRVGEIFKEPLKLNSAAVILAHNHPSGEPEPSPEDVLVTREIVAAGELLDVEVLDHLVIGQGRWVSLRERGLGFAKP